MKPLSLNIGILLILTSFFSCKKENAEPAPSKAQLLVAAPWTLTSSLLVENGVAKDHPYNKSKQCMKDNVYVFSKDQSYEITEGATRCMEANPNILNKGNWSLENKDNTLRVNPTLYGLSYDREILKLTADTLYLQLKSGTGIITEIYAHK